MAAKPSLIPATAGATAEIIAAFAKITPLAKSVGASSAVVAAVGAVLGVTPARRAPVPVALTRATIEYAAFAESLAAATATAVESFLSRPPLVADAVADAVAAEFAAAAAAPAAPDSFLLAKFQDHASLVASLSAARETIVVAPGAFHAALKSYEYGLRAPGLAFSTFATCHLAALNLLCSCTGNYVGNLSRTCGTLFLSLVSDNVATFECSVAIAIAFVVGVMRLIPADAVSALCSRPSVEITLVNGCVNIRTAGAPPADARLNRWLAPLGPLPLQLVAGGHQVCISLRNQSCCLISFVLPPHVLRNIYYYDARIARVIPDEDVPEMTSESTESAAEAGEVAEAAEAVETAEVVEVGESAEVVEAVEVVESAKVVEMDLEVGEVGESAEVVEVVEPGEAVEMDLEADETDEADGDEMVLEA